MGANSFMETEPLQININLVLKTEDIDLAYESEVLTKGDTAQWKGEAAVDYFSAVFFQDCHTLCKNGRSYKEWREKWVESDTKSPVGLIQSWIKAIGAGKGYYSKQPVIPGNEMEPFSSIQKETYCIKLNNQDPDWNSVCDVHPDSLFGGNSLIDAYNSWEVWLYFGAEDCELKAALILAGNDATWTNVFMVFERTQTKPQVDLTTMDIIEGQLSEEWSMETDEEG